MKKSLVVLLLFAFISISAFADQSSLWIVNELGERVSFKQVETGVNIDLGMLRLRQHPNTVGLLENGDKIAFIISNGEFVSSPIVLDPPADSTNKIGKSGDFKLVKVAKTGDKGDNAIIYELERKTVIDSQYRALDYVFHFNNINVLNEGDVKIYLLSGEKDDTYEKEIIKSEEILIAKAFTVIPDSISKTEYFKIEEISRELNKNFENSNLFKINQKDMLIEVPQRFFEQGDMLGTLNDERWTFRLVVNEAAGMRLNNPDFSDSIGLPIREMKFYKVDGFGNYSDTLAQRNFEPVKVTFKNLNPSSNETSKFVPIKYIENSDGTYTKELAGSGMYDNLNKSFSFLVNGPGIYSVEKKDAVNITMRVNDFFASVNNVQNRLDAAPQVINGFTYVPVRFIAENLGAEVEFLQATNQVEIKTGEKTIYLPIDKVTAELATPARIIEGRTMVPVRYVSEQLGATVTYFADTRKIEIIK